MISQDPNVTPSNGQVIPMAWFTSGPIPSAIPNADNQGSDSSLMSTSGSALSSNELTGPIFETVSSTPDQNLDSSLMSAPVSVSFDTELLQATPNAVQNPSIAIVSSTPASLVDLQSFISDYAASHAMSSSVLGNSVSNPLASASEAMSNPLLGASNGAIMASSSTQAFYASTLAPNDPSAAPTPTLDLASISWNANGNPYVASAPVATGLFQSDNSTLSNLIPTSTSSGFEFTTVSQTRNTSLYPVPTVFDPRYPSGSIQMTKPIRDRVTQLILVKVGSVIHFEWSTNYILVPPLNLTLQLELVTTGGQPVLAAQQVNPLGTIANANQKPVYIIAHDLNPNITSHKWNSSEWFDLNPMPITGLYTPVFYDAARGGRQGLRVSGYLDPSVQNAPLSIYFPQAYVDWNETMANGVKSDRDAEYCPSCILWDDHAQSRSGGGFLPSLMDQSSGSHTLLPSTLVTLTAMLFAYNLI